MNCPNCNAQNDNTADVCVVCGEPLDTEDIQIKEDKNAKLEELKMKRLRKKKNKKIKKAVIIIVIVAILLAIAAYGINLFNNSFIDRTNTDKTYVVPSPTPTATLPPVETPQPEPTEEITEETDLVEEVLPSQTPEAIVIPQATKAPSKPVSVPKATKKPVTPAVSSPGFTAGSLTQSAVVQGEPIVSTIVNALSVESAQYTGSSIVKFTIGNETYYAYADAASFAGGLPGMYSIDAIATQDVYYGLPVYSITRIDSYSANDYILSESSSRLLTEADLASLSKSQLELARNEIFARHGRIFKRQEVQKYFETKTWYKPSSSYNYSNDYKNLSDIELKNAKFILEFENK